MAIPFAKWLISTLCLIGTANALAAENHLDRIRKDQVVRVGFREGAVPFSYLLPGQERPVGYAIEICERAVADLGIALGLNQMKPVYVPVSSKDRFAALQSGAIDLECANTTVNSERRAKGFAFSVPYFITGTRLMVRGMPAATSLQGLAGRTVALVENTTTAKTVPALYPTERFGTRYIYVRTRAEAFDLLESGKADGMVEDDTVLYGLRARSRQPEQYTVTGSYLAVEPFAVMLRGEDGWMKQSLDRSLREMIRSGRLQEMHRRWFQSPIPPEGRLLDIPLGFLMRDFMRYPTDDVNAFP